MFMVTLLLFTDRPSVCEWCYNMVNTPIPHSLRSETLKAAKILRDFTIPSATAGPDKVIPGSSVIYPYLWPCNIVMCENRGCLACLMYVLFLLLQNIQHKVHTAWKYICHLSKGCLYVQIEKKTVSSLTIGAKKQSVLANPAFSGKWLLKCR